jgi:YbbR domain-containing protein
VRLPGFATRNLRLKGVAGVLAAVMWAGVAYASNPPDTRTVNASVPQTDAMLSPWVLVHSIPDLPIRVSGTRAHLNAFQVADLVVTVNYASITHAGVQSLPLSIVNNDRDVVLDNPPQGIVADVDRRDSRAVSVTVDVSQPPPQGYVVISSSTNPATVTVIGPQHQLAGVEARVTVNLANQKTNFQSDETVLLYDSHTGQRLGNFGLSITVGGHQQTTVLVTIEVAASLTSRASAVLAKVGPISPGHFLDAESVSPATVVLNGPQDLLNTLDSIPTQTISLNGITGTLSFTVDVVPPAGVTATPSTVTVTITVGSIPQPAPSATAVPTPAPTPAPTPSTSP